MELNGKFEGYMCETWFKWNMYVLVENGNELKMELVTVGKWYT